MSENKNSCFTRKAISYTVLKGRGSGGIANLVANDSLKKMFRRIVRTYFELVKREEQEFLEIKYEILSQKNTKQFYEKITDYYFRVEITNSYGPYFAELRLSSLFSYLFLKG